MLEVVAQGKTLLLGGRHMKVVEKILAVRLRRCLSWRGVLGIVPLSGAEGIRTPDLLRAREALSQLSYSPVFNKMIDAMLFLKANHV